MKILILFQNFDRYRCTWLVMECMCQFDDASMNRMSVAICSILAAKVNKKKCNCVDYKLSKAEISYPRSDVSIILSYKSL